MSAWSVVATSLLPPGEAHRRYRAEFDAELADTPWWRRPAAGVLLVLAAPALHRSLRESGALPFPHSPLWCRVRPRGHTWHPETTEDGSVYKRCLNCGIDYDGTMDSKMFGGYGIEMMGRY